VGLVCDGAYVFLNLVNETAAPELYVELTLALLRYYPGIAVEILIKPL
jgi:hypothetical protein